MEKSNDTQLIVLLFFLFLFFQVGCAIAQVLGSRERAAFFKSRSSDERPDARNIHNTQRPNLGR